MKKKNSKLFLTEKREGTIRERVTGLSWNCNQQKKTNSADKKVTNSIPLSSEKVEEIKRFFDIY